MPVSVCRVFDSAGTGRISVAELRNILFRIGYSPLQQEMENIDDIVRVGRCYISIYTTLDIYTVQVCSSDGGASVDYADLAKLLTSKTRSITDDVTSAGQ